MPGKYSHSVVLADYSSRGLISLPNEQHIAYLKSSPYPASIYSRSTSRAPSQGSNTPHTKSRNDSSQHGHRNGPRTAISPTGRYIIIDPTTVQGQHDRTPSNTQSVKSRSTSADPTPVSRRTYSDVMTKSTEPNNRSNVTAILPSKIKPVDVSTGTAETRQITGLSPSWNILNSPTVTRNESSGIVRNESSGQTLPTTKTILPTSATSSPVAPRISSDSMRNDGLRIEDSHRQFSSGSISVQQYRPLSPTVELDFEGFSDAEDTNTSYFHSRPILYGTNTSNGGAVTTNISRKTETPPPGLVSQSRQSTARTLQSSLSALSDRHLATSPDDHHGKHNSITSQSSLGSWGTPSTSRINKQVESNKIAIQSHGSLERLPEISEDSQFGPDLFAQALDNVKPPSHLAMEEFGGSSLGMISSGRDFMPNTESDSQSLASTACPPDIGRFRDDDVTETKQYLQPIRSPERRSASAHGSLLQNKKSRSLFSRLKSRALS